VRYLALCLVLLLAGCDVSMTQQKRYSTEAPAAFWPDGASARALPSHVVAQDDLARDRDAAKPPPVSPALLARGHERYDIYCSPCHGLDGAGTGMVVRRGFPKPPSYFDQRLLAAPAATFYDAMTKGYGTMYSYASRVVPRDRWAIIAYIRALQLSHHATLALAPDAREKLP
jgi:mono/diheme cytochrome c family protein